MASYVQYRGTPIVPAWLVRRLAILRHDLPKVNAKRPQAWHPRRAYGKGLMIRLDFQLHRTGQLHAVFLLIRGENRKQLCLRVRATKRRFGIVQPQNRSAVAKRLAVLVAAEQRGAV